jgi:hypothetical protein
MSRYPVSTVWIALPLLLCIHTQIRASENAAQNPRASLGATQTGLQTASIATESQDAALTAAASGDEHAKRTHIEQLMAMTNVLQLSSQMSRVMVNIMGQAIKGAHPGIPQKVIDALPDTVDTVVAEHLPELKEQMADLYATNFSDDDLVSIIEFYQTPVGRKLIRVMPAVMQQCTVIGIQWARSLGPEIEQRLNARFKKDDIRL